MSFIKVKFLMLFFVIALFSGCSNSDDAVADDQFTTTANASNVILRINKTVFDTLNSNRVLNISEGDEIKINSGKKNGDFLELSVSYSGGCKLHNFEIIWDGVVYTNNPCNLNLLLIHSESNDTCEAYITETILVNLKELLGNTTYSTDCVFNIYSTFNFTNIPNVKI